MANSSKSRARRWTAILTAVAVAFVPLAAQAQNDQALASSAPYQLKRGVRIPMRDGVNLSSNIYMPLSPSASVPAILIRTPYGKDSPNSDYFGKLFAGNGYALIIQDKRGRFESEGEYTISDHEVVDAYDTIDWISRQPWSNGRVGAYGCSDLGDAAIYAAVSRHPALKAVIPEAAGSTNGSAGGWYRYFGARNGGAVELAMGVGWMVDNGTKYFLRPPLALDWDEFIKLRPHYKINLQPPAVDYDQALRELPIIDILKNRGLAHTDWENIAGRELTDPFFKERDFLKGDERISVPALHVNSWYDFAPGATLWHQKFFQERATNATARDHQYVIMSPSLHCKSLQMTNDYKVGARPVGDPRIDLGDIYVRWFDHWLKGVENGVTAMPKIQYYMLGENKWRDASAWPVPGSTPLKLFLGGDAPNGPDAAGALTRKAPARPAVHRFTYDPADPAPTIGGSLCCISSDALEGAYDQREAERRPDVLTYSTPPLKKGLSVVGPVEVVLQASSSAVDTDFTAKLIDVYPDGTAYNLQEGILRARYREGFDKPRLMAPGATYQIKINLQDIANYFSPGHRIRLEISSSSFPRFDRNLNTGGRNFDESSWVVAKNTIGIGGVRPSYLMLRMIDGPAESLP